MPRRWQTQKHNYMLAMLAISLVGKSYINMFEFVTNDRGQQYDVGGHRNTDNTLCSRDATKAHPLLRAKFVWSLYIGTHAAEASYLHQSVLMYTEMVTNNGCVYNNESCISRFVLYWTPSVYAHFHYTPEASSVLRI